MSEMGQKVILASNSPRRKELLTRLGVDFTVMPSNIDEKNIIKSFVGKETSPYDTVKIISMKKAENISDKINYSSVIIAADTVVSINGKILGKPEDEEDAFYMLKLLQGSEHIVYTGVYIINKTESGINTKSFVETTAVFMRKLTGAEIRAYIKTGEPMDKAGAYGIQEKGSLLIEKVNGDFYTVVGLPLVRLHLSLLELGIDITKHN